MSDKHTDALDKLDKFQFAEGSKVLVHLDEVKALFRATEGQAQTSADKLDAERYRWLRSVGPEQQNVIAHYAMECMDERVDHFRAAQLADSTAPGAPVGDALTLTFSRETWGIIFDGVMLEIDRSEKRKLSNAASNSDERATEGRKILAAIRSASAAPTAQQSLTAGGAVPEGVWESAVDGWIFDYDITLSEQERKHLIFVGNEFANDFAAAPLPQVQSEALDVDRAPHCSWAEATAGGIFEEGSNAYKQYAHLFQDDPRYQADKAAYLKARVDQQPVTPSEKLEALATITLGGIETGIAGGELGDIDIEIIDKGRVEALQYQMVRTDEPVYLTLYAKVVTPSGALK